MATRNEHTFRLITTAVRPDLRITLVDSTRKKADFLSSAAEAMGVEVTVRNARAEDLAKERGRSYDLVTARAVAPSPVATATAVLILLNWRDSFFMRTFAPGSSTPPTR